MRKTSTWFFIVFFAAAVAACNSKAHKLTMDDLNLTIDTTKQYMYPFKPQRMVHQIADKIAKYETVDGKAVSIDGHESLQYKRFLQLKEIATERELIELTQHESGNVKAYAFEALCDRNSKNCKKVFEQHLNDKTKIDLHAGCFSSETYINLYYLDLLSGKLSAAEMADYKNKLKKSFTPEEWKFITEYPLGALIR